MSTTKLSDHFSLDEAIISDTAERYGISNEPDKVTVAVMGLSAVGMERVRASLGNKPILISSWYRSLQLNRVLKSKDTSQHVKGEAIDFICPGFGSPLDICKQLIKYKELIRYDQLILEHTWAHISFAISSGKPKGQVLSLLATGGYASGLTDKKGNPL